MSETPTDPSPTADATRLTEPDRTSPTAKRPGIVVSWGCGERESVHEFLVGERAVAGPSAGCDGGGVPTRLVNLVVDAADPPALARFWSAALAWPITFEDPDEVVIEPPEDDPAQAGQLPLVFVPVSEGDAPK